MKNVIPWSIVATAFAGAVGLAIFGWIQLPDKVASHFDSAGQPDGWMSKPKFLVIMIGVHIFMAVIMRFVSKIIRSTPISMVNIPNRDYWLAEERRESTFDEYENMIAWIAAGSAIFMTVMFSLAIDANLGKQQKMNSMVMWIAVGTFLVWLFGFLFVRLKKYYRVPVDIG